MENPELTCSMYNADRFVVRRTTPDDSVTHPIVFEAFGDGSAPVKDAYATANNARAFARGILALADEVDGGESAAPTPAVKVGDRVRVVKDDRHNFTGKFIGLVGVIGEVDLSSRLRYLVTFGPGRHGDADGTWYCEDVERVDEPAAVDQSSPAQVSRLELLVTRAKELLTGTEHTGADVIAMAAFLAGE
nr:hypothetical protein OG513_07585 [Streptomyces sp. NBC_00998]